MKEKSASLLVLVALLFLLAFSVRVIGFEHQTLPWADPWLHYTVTKTDYLKTHHYSPWNNLANFPKTGKNWTPPGFYHVLTIPYTVMSDYEEHLLYFFEFWPIIFGGFAVVLMYVLMKTFNKKIGFLSAFFLAVVSAASIRSSSGIYRGDVFLVVMLLLAIYSYLRIYKSPVLTSLKWIILEIGLLITAMLLFNGWVLILVILLSFSFFMSVINIIKKRTSFKNSFIAASVSIPSVAYLYCFNMLHDNLMPDFVFKLSLGIVTALAVIVYIDVAGYLVIRKKYLILAASLVLPVAVLGVFSETFSFLAGFFISRTAFFLPQSEVIRQIQELQPVTPSMYVSAFTSLILMVAFGGVLLFISLKKKSSRPHLPETLLCMLGVWLVFSLYLSVTFNRFLFTAAPGICAFSGMSFYYFLHSAERSLRSPIVRLLATYSVIFLYVLVPLFGSFYTYSQQEPYITPSWEKASYWFYNNSSKDASILTEWDQSNWFQALAVRCTATDTIMAQNPEKAANFFCTSPEKGLNYLQYKRIQYVALDKYTVARYYVMLQFATSPVPYEDSALCTLYFGEFPGFELVFQDEDVKMFKVLYETALVTNFFFDISGEQIYITIFTVNPLDKPVELDCSLKVQDMGSTDVFLRSMTITADPGTHYHITTLEVPDLSRFFIVLEEGNHAPLVRAVFLK